MADPCLPDVVIVTHDTRDEVLGCLASIPPGEAAQIVVVDSGSTDDTGEVLRREYPGVRVVGLANVGFGRGANTGIRATNADHVVVCNADVRFTPGALPAMAERLEADGEVAAVGPLVRYPDGTVQASARCMPDVRTAVVHGLLGRVAPGNAATRRYHVRDEPAHRPRDVDWLSGCALALRRAAVDEVGGFDPGYFLYVEDVDLGQRLRSGGWRLRYEPCARVVHTVGASTSQRRGRSLVAHARSLDRYQSRRLGGGFARVLLWPLRVALAGWVAGTWMVERLARDARSVTGERLVDPMPDASPPLALLVGEPPPIGTEAGADRHGRLGTVGSARSIGVAMPPVRDAMIVAGGGGTRLWPLTADHPKPLVGFCDAPFLEGVLHRLADIGVDRVLLVVGADPSPFEVLRPAARTMGIDLEAVPEPEPLDTAGGVRAALDRVRGTFLVLNGDILTDVDLGEVVAAHQRAEADASLVLTRVRDTSSFGVCVLEGERIVGFVEKPAPGSLPGQDAVNAGTYVLEPEAMARFDHGRLSFEREVFPTLVADGAHVAGVVSDAAWADLGTPERYLDGHRAALDGRVTWPSLEALPADADGVRIAPDARIDPAASLTGPVMVAAGAAVGPGARVGPHVVLGAGVVLGADTQVTDSVFGRRTTIGGGCRLTATITGEDAVIGDAVVAEQGAVLADGVSVPDAVSLPADARVGPGS